MSCCGGNCGCGSSCKCGSNCGGCGMYPVVEKDTTLTLTGARPMKTFSDDGSEVSYGAEGGHGCKCGSNCKCNPCNC